MSDTPRDSAESLRQEADMLELADRLQPKAPRSRWPVAATFVSALALATLLLAVRLPGTEIELDAVVAEVSFRLPVDHALSSQLSLQSLQWAGAQPGEAPSAGDLGASQSVRVGTGCSGTVLLESIVLPRGAHVWIARTADSRSWQLRLNAPGAVLQATMDGCVWVGSAASQGGPRNLLIRLGRDDLDIALQTVTAGPQFVPLLPVSALTFSRVDQVVRESGTLVREVSTLSSGTLVLPGLGDKERRLRFGEDLRFERSVGELRSIDAEGALVRLRFHGDVRGMTTGALEHRRSLMPTVLESLQAQHAMSLLWASALYAFGVFTALVRWWRGS